MKIELDPDPITGRRRQRWHSGYRTRRDAERARTELLSTIDNGTYVERSRATLSDFVREWLPAIAPTLRPSTLESYRRNLELHVLPHLGSTPLVRVDGAMLTALYGRLLADGRRGGRPGGLSPRSVAYVHTILHRLFKDAVRWQRLARNPCDAADPPRASAGGSPEIRAWSSAELRRFLDASRAAEDRYFPGWHVLAMTGARRGEVLGLRWSDVDLDPGRAAIRQTVIAVRHEVQFGTPKTARGRRSISLDALTVEVLRAWRRRQAEERLAIGPGYRDHGLVFARVDGGPLHPERFSREFERRVERWAFLGSQCTDLRHTWATLALQRGVHPRVVQERLGHSTIGVTLQTYSHVTATLHAEAADVVADEVLG